MKARRTRRKPVNSTSGDELIKKRLVEREKLFDRFYKKLLKLAKDMGTYSIIVPNFQMLSVMLKMKYDGDFIDTCHDFELCRNGYIRKLDGGYWIEVFPFTADAVGQIELKRV